MLINAKDSHAVHKVELCDDDNSGGERVEHKERVVAARFSVEIRCHSNNISNSSNSSSSSSRTTGSRAHKTCVRREERTRRKHKQYQTTHKSTGAIVRKLRALKVDGARESCSHAVRPATSD